MIEELKKDKTGSKFWQTVNQNKKRREGVEESIKSEDWVTHFEKQLGGREAGEIGEDQSSVREKYEDGSQETIEEEEANKVEEITQKEVEEVIKNLKRKKAPGADEIRNEVWIYGKEKLLKKLTEVLNKMWILRKTPEEWKEGIIFPIYKKGDKKKAENYRGITLKDTGYKIYTEIIRKRLRKQLEEKNGLNDTQMGFRKGKGTIDAIYVLKNAINEIIKREKRKVYVLFADLKGAFDKLSSNLKMNERDWDRRGLDKENKRVIYRDKKLHKNKRYNYRNDNFG